MALSKRTYVDEVTVITADNLNDIQDEIIANAASIGGKVDKVQGKGLSTNDYNNTDKEKVTALKNLANLEYVEVTS